MNFSTFVGNEKVKSELSYLLESQRFPHAIILEGEEGIGKKTLATQIAANLFCRESKNNACYNCPQCNKVVKNIHPDLAYYPKNPSKTKGFPIADVRDIREDVFIQPNEANYKVYILENCQTMSIEAQNAILKILEEPPSYAVFILTVNTKASLLDTVLSRCVVFSLKGVDSKQGAEYVCNNGEDIPFDEAQKAITVCSGNIGKALLTINDGKLSKISNVCNDVCKSLVDENEYNLLINLSVFEKDKALFPDAVTLLKSIFRDALLEGNNTDVLSGQIESIKLLSRKLTKQKLINMINVCDEAIDLARKNANINILITKFCYELRRAQNR